jgi:hypothetical protein
VTRDAVGGPATTREISFEPSLADVLAAYRLNYRVTLTRLSFLRAVAIGTALFAAAGGALQLYDGGHDIVLFALLGGVYWLVITAVLVTLRYLLLGLTVRRIYAQQKSLHDAAAVAWSDAEVTVTAARGTARHVWSDFIDVHADRRSIILRQSDALFNFIPRRVLSDEQAADLLRVARG